MLTTSQENSKHQYTLANCPKCVDTDFSTFYSNNCNNPHLPRKTYKIYYSEETHPCLATTSSLQCYITTLLSTSTIWTFRISCQHFSGHGKPQHGQHIIIRLLHMATLEGPLEQDTASPYRMCNAFPDIFVHSLPEILSFY